MSCKMMAEANAKYTRRAVRNMPQFRDRERCDMGRHIWLPEGDCLLFCGDKDGDLLHLNKEGVDSYYDCSDQFSNHQRNAKLGEYIARWIGLAGVDREAYLVMRERHTWLCASGRRGGWGAKK